MNFKKAFTLAEIILVLIIMGILVLVILQTVKPNTYDDKTNTAHAQKIYATLDNAAAQIIANERVQCPEGRFMVRPAGGSWEFVTKKTNGTDNADAAALVSLFGKYIKYEIDSLNFCDYTTACNSDIEGAKVVGGAYIGFTVYSDITDCPAYYVPGDNVQHPAPTMFEGGSMVNKKCWGEVRVDVNGIKGPDIVGNDVFTFGLGELGIER